MIDALERFVGAVSFCGPSGQRMIAPQSRVDMDERQSKWYRQLSGIRQGCPLSPYLFVIVISA
eukprot:6053619-Prorocentrum_lima.AAC.1